MALLTTDLQEYAPWECPERKEERKSNILPYRLVLLSLDLFPSVTEPVEVPAN